MRENIENIAVRHYVSVNLEKVEVGNFRGNLIKF